jgi:uncharacterized protein (DUF1778 family)
MNVAWAGVTFNVVATAMSIPLRSAKVIVEGDGNFRGALAMAKDVRRRRGLRCSTIGRTLGLVNFLPFGADMRRSQRAATQEERRSRGARLGFRVDDQTKALVELAAELERRKLTDYCLTALTEAARRTIARHEMLVLSDRDRKAFFDALINPLKPSSRLRRAARAERKRIAP